MLFYAICVCSLQKLYWYFQPLLPIWSDMASTNMLQPHEFYAGLNDVPWGGLINYWWHFLCYCSMLLVVSCFSVLIIASTFLLSIAWFLGLVDETMHFDHSAILIM